MANWRLWLNTKEEPALDAHDQTAVRVKGRDDVDLDVWFPPSSQPLLPIENGKRKSRFLSIRTHSAGPPTTDQHGLHLKLSPGTDLVWLLYPRLRSEKPPAVSVHGQPEALEVLTPAGTDYVFLAPKPQELHVADIRFRGTAGLVQVRGKQVTLTLCRPGEIRFGALQLKSERPASKSFSRQQADRGER